MDKDYYYLFEAAKFLDCPEEHLIHLWSISELEFRAVCKDVYIVFPHLYPCSYSGRIIRWKLSDHV